MDRLKQVIEKYKSQKGRLIELLQEISSEFTYLPKEVLKEVSKELQIPLTQLYSLATFYKSFKLTPPGKHRISICTGTTCHVRGASKIVENLERELQVEVGNTTKDGKFYIETVNCLGVCAIGPVVVIDNKYYGKMSSDKLIKLLKKL